MKKFTTNHTNHTNFYSKLSIVRVGSCGLKHFLISLTFTWPTPCYISSETPSRALLSGVFVVKILYP